MMEKETSYTKRLSMHDINLTHFLINIYIYIINVGQSRIYDELLQSQMGIILFFFFFLAFLFKTLGDGINILPLCPPLVFIFTFDILLASCY